MRQCIYLLLQNRFNSTLQLVKRQLQAGRFGKLAMVTVNVFWQRPRVTTTKIVGAALGNSMAVL